jgi:hypothetical protein
MSSRMIWNCRVVIVGANGQQGTIDLSANNLISVREIELFLSKATRMANELNQTHIEELGQPASARQPFRVVG